MHIRSLILGSLFCTFFSSHVQCVVKGSESVVSVEPSFTFPQADNDNQIAAFGWFKNGFLLENSSTSCIFNSVYPVSGTVNLNGGTLMLYQDLIFKNLTTLQGLGVIQGNNYLLDFSSSVTHFPSSTQSFQDVTINLNHDMVVTSTITFVGNCTLIGNSNTITFGANGAFVAAPNAVLRLQNCTLQGVKNSNVQCADNSASLILDSILWVQDGAFTFAQGSFTIVDSVKLVGAADFVYSSARTSTISANSELCISQDMHLTLGRYSAVNGVEPLAFEDSTSVLKFDNCSLNVTQHGMQLTKGKIVFDRDVGIDIVGTATTNGVAMGNGQIADDFTLQFNSGSTVTLHSGYFVYNNTVPDKILATSKSACLARDIASRVYLAQSLVFPPMTMQINSYLTPPIEIVDGKTLEYDHTYVALPEAEFEVKSNRYDQATFYLNGNDSIFMSKGAFPLKVLALNTGNKIQGNGSLENIVTLQDSATELLFDFQGLVGQNVYLGGGRIIFGNHVTWGANAFFQGQGTVDLDKYRMNLGSRDLTLTSTVKFEGTEGSIALNSTVSLMSTYTFYGSITIDGNRNTLDFKEGGSIVVGEGATLTLRDIRLDHVKGYNIRCLADSSSLILDNVEWIQDSDYTFTVGSILFQNQVDCTGDGTFYYSSKRTSSIVGYSTWNLYDGLDLSIGRQQDGIEPLWFEDITSVLHLRNNGFYVTSGGIQVTHGRAVLDHEVIIDINSTSTANGVICGSGNAADDFIVQYDAGSTVRTKRGHISFNNITLPSIKPIAHKSARLIRSENSYMYFHQPVTLPPMTVELESDYVPPIQFAPGISLLYENVNVITPQIDFDLSGKVLNTYTYGLHGNQSLFLNKGLMPMYASVAGTGNVIQGNGSINGAVIFANSSAALAYGLHGNMRNAIMLNGGSVTLKEDAAFAGTGMFVGPGMVYMGGQRVVLGEQETTWSTPLHWHGTNSVINLSANLSLLETWTCHTSMTIDGHDNTLAFQTNGRLFIPSHSTLTLRNIELDGVVHNSIMCEDDTASLVLENVRWIQQDDVTWTYGSIEFKNDVKFAGSFTFTYDSLLTSTIHKYSEWNIYDGMTLAIGKKTAGDAPLYFEDVNAILCFKNARYRGTGLGMQLSHGTLVFDLEVHVDMDSTSTDNGIICGTGQAEDDFVVQYNAGSNVRFNTGHVVFNNLTLPAIKPVGHQSARLIRDVGSHMYFKRSVNLLPMTVEILSNLVPPIVIADGQTLQYSAVNVVLPDVNFELSGYMMHTFLYGLLGEQTLYVLKGLMPLYGYISGAGNQIVGPGGMSGLITLANSSAALSYGVAGLTSNSILLNGGTLSLEDGLNFSGTAMVVGPGTVNLNNNRVSFGAQPIMCSTSLAWGGVGGALALNSQVSLTSTWTFTSNCTIDGRGNTLDLSSGGSIVVQPGVTLTFKDITIKGLQNQVIKCVDDTASLVLNDVRWLQKGDFTFANGSIYIKNYTDFIGDYNFYYESVRTSTIDAYAQWRMKDGMAFHVGRVMPGVEPLYFTNKTSVLRFDKADFYVTSGGMLLTHGLVMIDHQVSVDIDSTTTTNGVVVGTGNVDDDFGIRYNAGATLRMVRGHMTLRNSDPTTFRSAAGKDGRLTRALESNIYVDQNITIPTFTIELESNYVPAMVITPGRVIQYDNIAVITPDVEFDLTGVVVNPYLSALNNGQSLFLNRGTYPLYTSVGGTGNRIHGSGNLSGMVLLQDPASQLIYNLSGVLGNSLVLYGGLVTLLCDLVLGPGITIVGPGTVAVGGNKVQFGAQSSTWASPIYWDCAQGGLILNAPVQLSNSWTFSGQAIIDGRNNILTLDTAGELLIEQGSQLTLKNMTLKGVLGDNVRCLDNAGKLILENVVWVQDGAYEFQTGQLRVNETVKLSGDAIFAYESSQTSTISKNASLQLDYGMTFSYDPQASAAKNLIVMEDNRSRIVMHQATLWVPSTGMSLQKGKLILVQDSVLKAETDQIDEETLIDEGLTLGDGLVEGNDCMLIVGNGSEFEVMSGSLVYNNLKAGSLKMRNNTSIIKIASGAKLQMYQGMNLGEGSINFFNDTTLARVADKNIIGSINTFGNIFFTTLNAP